MLQVKLVLLCVTLLLSSLAQAAPAHVHGAAKLDLAVEGDKMTLSMEIPLDSTVGFERPARNEKEKSALAAMLATLRNGADLFVPSPAAGCKIDSVSVADPFPNGTAKADGHADVDADYVFRCAQPALLKAIETRLFSKFNRLQRIDVQRATPGGQGAGKLTPQQPKLSW